MPATMPLKYKCKTKDEIPAEHLPLYAEREGAWVLDVDGAVEKSKLDEFRNNNVALAKERDDLKKRYEGIDPDAVSACVASSVSGCSCAASNASRRWRKAASPSHDIEKRGALLHRLGQCQGEQRFFG